MKKLLSLLLVFSLTLAMVAVGIATVVAAETEFVGEISASGTVAAKSDYHARYYVPLDDPDIESKYLTFAEGEKYYFEIKAPKGAKIGIAIASEAKPHATQPGRFTYKSRSATYTKTTDDWETFEFNVPAPSTTNYSKINYVHIGAAMKTSDATAAGITELKFSLRNADVLDCLSKDSHTHVWSTEYTYDGLHHWYTCSEDCPITDNAEKKGYFSHYYDSESDMICDACGYDRTPPPPEKEEVPEGVQFIVDPSKPKSTVDMKPTLNPDTVRDFSVGTMGNMSVTDSKNAYIYFTADGFDRKNGFYLEKKVVAPFVGNEDQLVVSGWVYFSNINSHELIMQLIPEGCLKNDVGGNYTEKWAYRYNFKTMGKDKYVNGWNFINIPLSEFKKGTDENDHTRTAYELLNVSKTLVAVTFHDNGKANYGQYDFAVASLAIGTKAYMDAETPDNQGGTSTDKPTAPKNIFFVSSTEEKVTGGSGKWESVNVGGKEGEAFFANNGTGQTFTIQHKGFTASTAVGNKASFWVFISNVNAIKEFQWEIASSGDCQGACVRYVIKGDDLRKMLGGNSENVWFNLPFEIEDSSNVKESKIEYGTYSDYYGFGGGGKMTGNVDYKNVNFFRIVCHVNSAQQGCTVGIYRLNLGGSGNGLGDTTPVVSIALITLAAALIAGGVFFYIKRRTVR